MPACSHYTAAEIMKEHGNAVLTYIDKFEEYPVLSMTDDWDSISSLYLLRAVELWCQENKNLADWDNKEAIAA